MQQYIAIAYHPKKVVYIKSKSNSDKRLLQHLKNTLAEFNLATYIIRAENINKAYDVFKQQTQLQYNRVDLSYIKRLNILQ